MDESIIYIVAVALAFVLIFLNSKKIKALRRGGHVSSLTTEDAQKYHQALSGNFRFYQDLNFDERKNFLQRLHDFVESKTFVGQGQFIITDEVKIFIGALAVELTFYQKRIGFTAYDTVYVFDTTFAPSPEEAMGAASKKGRIAFSWPDFKLGNVKTNAFNAGVYQVAHAFEMSVAAGNGPGDFKRRLAQWKDASATDIAAMRDSTVLEWNGYNPKKLTRDFPLVAAQFFGAPQTFPKHFKHVSESFRALMQP